MDYQIIHLQYEMGNRQQSFLNVESLPLKLKSGMKNGIQYKEGSLELQKPGTEYEILHFCLIYIDNFESQITIIYIKTDGS